MIDTINPKTSTGISVHASADLEDAIELQDDIASGQLAIQRGQDRVAAAADAALADAATQGASVKGKAGAKAGAKSKTIEVLSDIQDEGIDAIGKGDGTQPAVSTGTGVSLAALGGSLTLPTK